jgi:hypothetical protein
MRFEGRELKDYAEPVLPDQLQEGKVYFAVVFLDKDGLVPSVEPYLLAQKLSPKVTSTIFKTSPPTGAGYVSIRPMLMKKLPS